MQRKQRIEVLTRAYEVLLKHTDASGTWLDYCGSIQSLRAERDTAIRLEEMREVRGCNKAT